MQDEESGGYCGVERDGGDGFHGRGAYTIVREAAKRRSNRRS